MASISSISSTVHVVTLPVNKMGNGFVCLPQTQAPVEVTTPSWRASNIASSSDIAVVGFESPFNAFQGVPR